MNRSAKLAPNPLLALLVSIWALGIPVLTDAQDVRALKVMFYDFKNGHPDFDTYRGGNRFQTNMLAPDLPKVPYSKGTKKMPRKGSADFYSASIEDWYNPDKAAGTACRTLYLQNVGTAESPKWRYDQCTQGCRSSCGGGTCQTFFPIDSIPSAQLLMDGAHDGKPHNYNWTMELNASFTYRGGETFYFKGDDDLWVFINNQLALDFGGIHDPLQNQSISLDVLASSLGITVGGTYDIDVYFAERKGESSTFFIESTIDLKPAELSKITIVDTLGNELSGTVQVRGPVRFGIKPTFTYDGEGQCTNYGTPPSLASSVDAKWMLGSTVAADKSGYVVITPEMIGPGGSISLSATAIDPQTQAQRVSSISLMPTVVVAPDSAAFAGDGRLESIRVYFDNLASYLPSGWSVTVSFDGQSFTLGAANTTAQGKTVSFNVPAAQLQPAGNSSAAGGTCTFSSVDTTASITPLDRMTPSVNERTPPRFTTATASEGHRLIFVVSEDVGNLALGDITITHNGAPLSIDIDKTTMVASASLTYTVTFPLESTILPVAGDSLTLKTSVKDSSGNAALRHPVRIEGDTIARASIRAVAFYDRDADGRIDSATVTFDRALIVPPRGIQLTNNGVTHAVDTSKGDRVALDNAGGRATVSISLGAQNVLQPNVTYLASPRLRLADQPFQGIVGVSTDNISDLAAPVVTSASYAVRNLALRADADSILDTLEVTFSEPARLGSTLSGLSCRPFRLTDSTDAAPYSLELALHLAEQGKTMRFLVLSSSKGLSLPGRGDSLWIDPSGTIRDMGAATQTNEKNRRVPLVLRMPPLKLLVALAPNPFNPAQGGVTVMVKPEAEPAGWVDFRASGRIWIYDAVGNMIVEGESLQAGDSHELAFRWDGTNRNGRLVGSGTYMAVVQTDDNMNGRRVTRLKIGVQR